MVEIQRSSKNLELDTTVAKIWATQLRFFRCEQQIPRKRQIPWHSMKIRVPRNTAGPATDTFKNGLDRLRKTQEIMYDFKG